MKKNNPKTNYLLKGIRILFVLMIILAGQQSYSQAIMQPKHILGEREHLVVSGSVMKCDTSNQIHLKITNNGQDTISTDFDLVITNTKTGKSYSKNVTVSGLLPGKSSEGTCKTNSALVFTLPKDYNPGNVMMMVKF